MDSSRFGRRHFFQTMGLGLLAGVALPLFARAQERRRGGGASATGGGDLNLPMAQEGKEQAGVMNYAEKHEDVKKADLKIDRMGVAFKDQKCVGCALYVPVGQKDGKAVGKCQVIPGKLVVADGWCATWTKKA